MKKIFENIDYIQVGLRQSILASEGVETLVKNYELSATAGVIAPSDCFPELWIVEDSDFERAVEVLNSYNSSSPVTEASWVCSKCGSSVDGNFGACWNCSTPRPEDALDRNLS